MYKHAKKILISKEVLKIAKLTEQELMVVEGGGIKVSVLAAIAGFGVFIIGVFDGLIRPLKCLKRWKD